jgi:hypothetical protein
MNPQAVHKETPARSRERVRVKRAARDSANGIAKRHGEIYNARDLSGPARQV